MSAIFFIPGNVPSLKNSKIKTSRGVFSSKSVKRYLQNIGIQKYSTRDKTVKGYVTRPNLFEDYKEYFKDIDRDSPTVIQFHFVRGSKHRFDFGNAVELLADLFTAHDFIEDDNMDYFIPMPWKRKGKWYSYDKENPGVYIKVD